MSTIPATAIAASVEVSTDQDASFVVDRTTPSWRQFELDVVKTIQHLDPAAEVLHDQKVTGFYSGTERQLDAVAKKSIAGAPVDMVIECKQYKNKLGIGKIDEFVGKLIDVGCSHGILYATSGATEPARRRAAGSISPKVTLRDMSAVAEFLATNSGSGIKIDEFLDAQAVDFSSLVEEAVLGNCQSENCWYGEVSFYPMDGILVGTCDSCGQLHVQCACCDEVSEIDWSSGECFVCGANYHVVSYKGDLDGMEQTSHGPDCEGEHPSEDGVPSRCSSSAAPTRPSTFPLGSSLTSSETTRSPYSEPTRHSPQASTPQPRSSRPRSGQA